MDAGRARREEAEAVLGSRRQRLVEHDEHIDVRGVVEVTSSERPEDDHAARGWSGPEALGELSRRSQRLVPLGAPPAQRWCPPGAHDSSPGERPPSASVSPPSSVSASLESSSQTASAQASVVAVVLEARSASTAE